MSTEVSALKTSLRGEVRQRLKAMTASQRAAESSRARVLLTAQHRWHRAKSILFFAPLAEELDIWPLLSQALDAGKKVALPRLPPGTNNYVACQVKDPETELIVGRYGIREPVERCAELPLNRLDLILVPGVAFDLHGRRLGRGKGFYDRLLAAVRGSTCGVAFDEQIVGEIPIEPHDVHLNCILTPTRWIEL